MAGGGAGAWPRRTVLARAAAVLGTAGLGTLVPAAARAQPVRQNGKVHLVVSVAYQGAGTYQGTMQQIVDEYLAVHWLAKHPGVTLTTIAGMGCNGTCLGTQDEIAATLAGEPADVITGCCNGWYDYLSANMMRPLDPYIKQDNIDLSVFAPGHIAALTTSEGLLALPEYDGPEVMLVNLGLLDDLGIPYPPENWTWQDADKLWRSVAGMHQGHWLYGASIDVPDGGWEVAGFGGAYGNADGTTATLDSPQCVQAYTWWMDLLQHNIILGNNSNQIPGSSSAMLMLGGWTIQAAVRIIRSGKWRYWPMPKFPVRQSTFINNDFYAINNYSKNPPELVWDIFKFLVLDRGFQQLQWRTTFVTPNRIDLWPDWFEIVYAVAPPLRNVNLEAYQGALSYGVSQYFWKYDNVQANNIVNQYLNGIQQRQYSVPVGLTQATDQINALEAVAGPRFAAEQAEQAKVSREISLAEAGQLTAFSPPPTVGAGVSYAPAGSLVTVKNGAYTLTGYGDVDHSVTNATFACTDTEALQATFTCRLISLVNLTKQPVASNAKVGLLLAQDLSNDMINVHLNLSYQDGITQASVQFPQVHHPAHVALSNASALLLPTNSPPGKNLLKAPVWLRIVRDIDRFTCYWSLDGATWKQVAPPVTTFLGGAWVGLFVSSHDPKHGIQATFDHLSGFTPTRFVVLGGAGAA
jgi:ABC-type glycerol-3-phosphate transport system substrate-binding protein